MSNNYAYIDGQNLHFGIKSMGWKIDHKKFRAYLEKEHGVSKAYIFLGFMEEHQDLYNVLQEAGFICFFKPLVRYDDGNIKGNVDADMVLQAMIDIENYDQAVIITGDGDFSGLLRHLMSRNKLARMVIPNKEKYSSLFDRIDGFDEKHVTYMNDLRSQLQYRPTKKVHTAKAQTPEANKKKPMRAYHARPARKTTTKGKSQKSASRVAKGNSRKTTNRSTSGFKPKAQIEESLLNAINESGE